MEYDIIKFIFPCLGLFTGLYIIFKAKPTELKSKLFLNVVIAAFMFVIVAVVFHSMVEGHFTPSTLIDFLTLRKIGVSGPRKILAFGYFLLSWGLPVLIFRKRNQTGLTSGSTAGRD